MRPTILFDHTPRPGKTTNKKLQILFFSSGMRQDFTNLGVLDHNIKPIVML